MEKRSDNKNKIIIDIPKGKGIIGFIRRNQNIISIIIFVGLVIGICVIFVPILDILKSFLLSLISPVEDDNSISNTVPAVLSLPTVADHLIFRTLRRIDNLQKLF